MKEKSPKCRNIFFSHHYCPNLIISRNVEISTFMRNAKHFCTVNFVLSQLSS